MRLVFVGSRSSLKVTNVKLLRVSPVYAASIVSKLLAAVVIVTAPLAGAVQVHQTDLPPSNDGSRSPGSRVAPTLLPVVVTFVDKFKKRWNGEVPDAMCALGYDSAMVLIEAIKRAGSTDGAKIRDAIAATKNYPGITGNTTLDANRNATKAAVVVTIKNGQFKFVETVAP